MSGHCPKCGAYHEEDVDRLCSGCLREAVRVLAKFVYENGRGCGTRTATERDDDMKIHRGNLYANPIAKAALDAAGGA